MAVTMDNSGTANTGAGSAGAGSRGSGTTSADSTKLGCGRTIDDIWDRIGQTPDSHEATCSDCQTARANLEDLAQATRAMATTDVADPTLHASQNVIAHILRVARAEVRRGKILPLYRTLPSTPGADLAISEQTIASVVRRTCDQMLGVEARRCHIDLHPTDSSSRTATPDSARSAQPAEVDVHLTLSVAPRIAIAILAQNVRTRVIDAIAQEVGIVARTVDIAVEDVDRAF